MSNRFDIIKMHYDTPASNIKDTFCRKENHCLVQYIIDKYGDDAHKFAIGLKAGSYMNVFEWQNAVAETSATEIDFEVPAFTNWAPDSPSGTGDCVFMAIGGVRSFS
jgi:hypothetical protein